MLWECGGCIGVGGVKWRLSLRPRCGIGWSHPPVPGLVPFRSAQVYWSGQPGAGHQILDGGKFWGVCPAHRVHADFGLGCGKIGKKFWHCRRIWPPPCARGGALRAGGRTHNAVYNPIPTSISRFFFIYDTCFLFLSSDYQAHVNYDDFSFYYNDSKERKNIYIYISRERKKSAFLTCAIFVYGCTVLVQERGARCHYSHRHRWWPHIFGFKRDLGWWWGGNFESKTSLAACFW